MFVLHVSPSGSDLYTVSHDAVHKQSSTQSRDTLLSDRARKENAGVVLLPEDHFFLQSYTICCAQDTPFSIRQYKKIVTEKQQQFLETYHIDPIGLETWVLLEGKHDQYVLRDLLGKTGSFQFMICFSSPKPSIQQHLARLFPSLMQRPSCRILPRYGAVVMQSTIQSGRDSAVLCVLSGEHAEKIQITTGRYASYSTAPLGTDILVQAAEEQEVQKYLFDKSGGTETNPLAKKLLAEAVQFYVEQLVRWVESDREGEVVLFSCSFVSHPLFMELLQDAFRQTKSRLIPLVPSTFPGFAGYHRTTDELPVQAVLHQYATTRSTNYST